MIGIVIFGLLIVFFPVAAYLLYLAVLNGRPHPTLISGPWEFAGALFATSGFWLMGGPVVLSIFHARWRPALLRGDTMDIASGDWAFVWVLLWIAYFVVVLGGAVLLLRRRRNVTLIYNIEPPLFDEALAQVANNLGVAANRIGNRVSFHPTNYDAAPADATAIQAAHGSAGNGLRTAVNVGAATALGQPVAEVTLDPFPAMHNIALRWQREGATFRNDMEAELARLFAQVESPENPVSGWCLTVSSCIFSAIFLGLVAFVLFSMRR